MTKNTVELDVGVDNLPEALSSLPRDTSTWESALADELNKQHKAEQALNVVRCQTSLAVRTDPLKYGFPKLTEDLVKTIVETQQSVMDAEQALIEAKLAVNSTRAVVNALDAKRSACKYLTELVVRGFVNSNPTGSLE